MDHRTLNVIRNDRYKYVHFAALPPLFFDRAADPHETTNLAAGEESPWFPGCRVYRQTAAGSWDEAFGALASDLASAWPG